MGSFRKFLDRDRNAFGKIKPAPSGREDNHQRDEEQGQNIAIFDRRLEKHQVFVLFVGTGDLQGSFSDAFGHIVVDHHNSEHALIRAVDGNPATDNVPFSKRLGSRHLQTPERPVEKLIFRFDRDPRRHLFIERDDE